jgi:hypothetical protein
MLRRAKCSKIEVVAPEEEVCCEPYLFILRILNQCSSLADHTVVGDLVKRTKTCAIHQKMAK